MSSSLNPLPECKALPTSLDSVDFPLVIVLPLAFVTQCPLHVSLQEYWITLNQYMLSSFRSTNKRNFGSYGLGSSSLRVK